MSVSVQSKTQFVPLLLTKPSPLAKICVCQHECERINESLCLDILFCEAHAEVQQGLMRLIWVQCTDDCMVNCTLYYTLC